MINFISLATLTPLLMTLIPLLMRFKFLNHSLVLIGKLNMLIFMGAWSLLLCGSLVILIIIGYSLAVRNKVPLLDFYAFIPEVICHLPSSLIFHQIFYHLQDKIPKALLSLFLN